MTEQATEKLFEIKFRLSFYNDKKSFKDEYKIVGIEEVLISKIGEESSYSELYSEIYEAKSKQPFTIVLIRKGKKFPEMGSVTVCGSPHQDSVFEF